MSELQKQILLLPVSERIQLIAFIASSITDKEVDENWVIPQEWINEYPTVFPDDIEVINTMLARRAELKSGKRKSISRAELMRRVKEGMKE